MATSQIDRISKLASEGRRISDDDARLLFKTATLPEIGLIANSVRQRHNPGKIVTYLVDRNINYTNVCNTDCSFCAFYRHDPKDPEAYVNSREVIGRKIEEALALGATRILLQGGHNDNLPYSYYTDLISWIKLNYPIEINAFSPSEIHQMHLISKRSYRDILIELKSLGLASLPGGGGEMLDDEIRSRVSPKKISADTWIEIMEIAQDIGLTTTSTMVIGFGETIDHRIRHLNRLRELQDRTLAKGKAGFICFISWQLQLNENTSMGRSRNISLFGAGHLEYLRMVALNRIYLDNIQHHQCGWPTCGAEVAAIGLQLGCDDFGSTMIEENVVSQAGAVSAVKSIMLPEELQSFIREAGYIPAQRDSSFNILKTFDDLSLNLAA